MPEFTPSFDPEDASPIVLVEGEFDDGYYFAEPGRMTVREAVLLIRDLSAALATAHGLSRTEVGRRELEGLKAQAASR